MQLSLSCITLHHEADHLVIDGAFESAPSLFMQMLGVHGVFDENWHLPLVFELLPGKSQVLYEYFLEQLDSFGPLYPQSILCDYEIGLRNACSSTWPSSTVQGCNFHFTKATFKHLFDLGLRKEYDVEGASNVRRYYKIISALPFIPTYEELSAWEQLRPLLPAHLFFFATYFEYTWVGSRSCTPSSQFYHQYCRGMASRVQQQAELQPFYHLEVPGGIEEGTEPDQMQHGRMRQLVEPK